MRRGKGTLDRRGIALMVVLQLLLVVSVIGFAFIYTTNNNLFVMGQQRSDLQAFYVAEAGLDRITKEIFDSVRGGQGGSTGDPFNGLTAYFASTAHANPINGIVVGSDTNNVGSYQVTCTVSQVYTTNSASGVSTDPSYNAADATNAALAQNNYYAYKKVTITSVGSAPYGVLFPMHKTVQQTVIVGLRVADPFSFGYFCNNWGYWAGMSGSWGYGGGNQPDFLYIEGNTGANGNYEVYNIGSSTPFNVHANGNPTYDQLGRVTSLAAVQAAVNIDIPASSAAQGVTIAGYGGQNSAAHPGQANGVPYMQFPNLADGNYIATVCWGGGYVPSPKMGTVSQGAATLWQGVYDHGVLSTSAGHAVVTPGPPNVVLDGSVTPIHIDGPCEVNGDCVIRGKITGQGTLYVRGNLYVAADVTYANPPTGAGNDPMVLDGRPMFDYASGETASAYYTAMKSWMTSNNSADAIAFAVRNNIVFGDAMQERYSTVPSGGVWPALHQYNQWQAAGFFDLAPWLLQNQTGFNTTELVNDNHEDSGPDKIWGNASSPTSPDLLENDKNWTVGVYDSSGNQTTTTLTNPAPGATVSNVIPGTGEDVDGDGKYTGPFNSNGSDFFLNGKSSDATFPAVAMPATFDGNNVNGFNFFGAPVPTAQPNNVVGHWPLSAYGMFCTQNGTVGVPPSAGNINPYASTLPNQISYPEMTVTHLDGFYYTNNAMMGFLTPPGNNSTLRVRGGFAMREDGNLYNNGFTNAKCVIEHDERFSIADQKLGPQLYLPPVVGVTKTAWQQLQ
jgi:Tfp pilus assembly protein PilX